MIKRDVSENLLITSLLVCIAQAYLEFLGIISKNFVNPTNILELTFILLCARNIGPTDLKRALLAFALGVLGTSFILLSNLNAVPYFESIRAYKWLLFLILMLAIKNQIRFRNTTIKKIYLILLISLFIAYFVQVNTKGLNSRPSLIIENNYECALLIGFYVANLYISNFDLTRKYLVPNLILVVTILMSQSRSALIALFLILSLSYTRKNPILKNPMSSIMLFITGLFLIFYTFTNRGTSFGSLDRFKFLNLFLKNFGNRPTIEKLFGNWIIEPLNAETCVQLRFYSSLQNNESLGSCYSVVLHAFVIRAIYDFGIVGALLIFYTFSKILLSNLERNSAICFIFIAITNSLSVSGVNNVYVVLPMLISLLSNNIKSKKKSFNHFSKGD